MTTSFVYIITENGTIQHSSSPHKEDRTIQQILSDIDWSGILASGQPCFFHEVRPRLQQGEFAGFFWTLEVLPLDGNQETNSVSLFCCTLRKRQRNHTVKHELQKLKEIVNAMPFGVAVIRQNKEICAMNKAALELAGYDSLEELAGSKKSCQNSFCPAPKGECPVWEKGQLFDRTERPFLLRDGTEVQVMKSAVPIDIAGETMMLESIIDLRKEKKLEQMAKTDPLTGILNRTGMAEDFEKLYRKSLEKGRGFSLLMIDLDNFKDINDIHGHSRGDEVLQTFAHTMGNFLSHEDCFCRWGGDEFLVATPLGTKKGMALGRTILQAVAEGAFGSSGLHIPLVFSMGIATASKDSEETLEELIKKADHAMYCAKRMQCGIYAWEKVSQEERPQTKEGNRDGGKKQKTNPL